MMRRFEAEQLPPEGHFHYHQGVFLSGMLKIWQLTGEERYFDYAKTWVDACLDEEGRPKDFNKGQLDDIQPGILLFPLLEKTGNEKYRKALEILLPVVRDFPRCKDGGFWHKEWFPRQMWLDGLYMAGPISAEYASRFAHPEYFDLCAQQAFLMREKTEDVRTGLWYHAWDESRKEEWADPETGRSPEFWGRSIGWVPVAVLDELDFFPEDHPAGDTERACGSGGIWLDGYDRRGLSWRERRKIHGYRQRSTPDHRRRGRHSRHNQQSSQLSSARQKMAFLSYQKRRAIFSVKSIQDASPVFSSMGISTLHSPSTVPAQVLKYPHTAQSCVICSGSISKTYSS